MASGLAFRLCLVGGGIDLDESVTEYVSSSTSFQELLDRIVHYEFGPPLYFYLMMLWRKVSPDETVFLALPSLFFGMCLIPLTYLLAKKLTDSTQAGMLSAFFCALSPLAMFYSHEARTYSLFACLNVTTAFFLISWLKEKKLISIIAFAFFACLVIYTHYLGIAFLGLLAAGAFLYCWLDKSISLFYKTLPVFFVPPALFLFWLPYMKEHLKVGTFWVDRTPLEKWWQVIASNTAALSPFPWLIACFISIPIILYVVFLVSTKKLTIDKSAAAFLLTIILPPALLLGYITPFIMGYCRYMMPFAPFAWILFSMLLINLNLNRKLLMTLLVVLTLTNGYEAYCLGSGDRSGLRQLAADETFKYHDNLILVLPDFDTYTFKYYLRTQIVSDSLDTGSQTQIVSFPHLDMNTPAVHQGYADSWTDPQNVERLMTYLDSQSGKVLTVVRDPAVLDSKLMPAKSKCEEVMTKIRDRYQKIGDTITYPGRGRSFLVERFNLSSNK